MVAFQDVFPKPVEINSVLLADGCDQRQIVFANALRHEGGVESFFHDSAIISGVKREPVGGVGAGGDFARWKYPPAAVAVFVPPV